MEKFEPEYPGDTPNRQHVRRMMEKAGYKVDYFEMIRRMSAAHIELMFDDIVTASLHVVAAGEGN